MDNVLVDFQSGIDQLGEQVKQEYKERLDEVPGILGLMKPLEGAIDAVQRLAKKYAVYILSTAPWLNVTAWEDKVKWIQNNYKYDRHKINYINNNFKFECIPNLSKNGFVKSPDLVVAPINVNGLTSTFILLAETP